MKNPLLSEFYSPQFSNICPSHIVPAIKFAIQRCHNTIEEVLNYKNVTFTWENIYYPIANADDHLNKVWSLTEHLNSVNYTEEFHKEYEIGLQLISDYTTWVSQHKGLYQIYKKFKNSNYYTKLSISKKKAIENLIQDFELSGINLSNDMKKKYANIVVRLSKLSCIYSNNVLHSTVAWSKLITNQQDLDGLPEYSLYIARERAKKNKKQGWLLTLDNAFYISVLTHCNNNKIREEIYYAYNTRASDQGIHANKWDNGPIMHEILSLRHELAKLMKFNNYVELSLAKKMAKSPKEVLSFLNRLTKKIYPHSQRELIQLQNFARKHFDCKKLEPWDILYYSEKQKNYLFDINEEQIRLFFPEFKVLQGLFKIAEKIYEIKIVESFNVNKWHSDVRFFNIFNKHGDLKGGFYIDLYFRKNKRSGAWMSSCTEMISKPNGVIQKPLAYLICNFNSPVFNEKFLFTHNDIITLFHEFGHVLHHTLTCVDVPGVSGINGIPWDAVEISSQFMENYCWEKHSLSLISENYKTKEPIPEVLLNKIIKTRKYQSGLFIMRQVELSLFDIMIHYQYKSDNSFSIIKILNSIKKSISVIPNASWNRFPNTFNHIFSGGYAAGYYSYLWSNVLSSDIWDSFKKNGIFNKNTSLAFLNEIISKGGSENPSVLFKRFKKRNPQIEAMLRLYGFLENNSSS